MARNKKNRNKNSQKYRKQSENHGVSREEREICICYAAGALIYLLDLYCNSSNAAVREKTADLFAKLLSDKLNGPKVRILLAKFLPPVFMDAMRDSPEASVHMFESKSRHLINHSATFSVRDWNFYFNVTLRQCDRPNFVGISY